MATSSAAAVIWDMDGTLFDTERLNTECMEEVCLALGYANPRETLYKLIGRTVKDSDDIMRADFGESFDPALLRTQMGRLFEDRIREKGIPVKSGVHAVLEWLSLRTIPMAIASSSHHSTILRRLELTKLSEYFKIIIGGDQVQNGKPDPEIFLRTACELNVDPAKCIVFEDSLNGVLSGHAAGTKVVMVPDLTPPTPDILQCVYAVVPSVDEAIPILMKLLKNVTHQ